MWSQWEWVRKSISGERAPSIERIPSAYTLDAHAKPASKRTGRFPSNRKTADQVSPTTWKSRVTRPVCEESECTS